MKLLHSCLLFAVASGSLNAQVPFDYVVVALRTTNSADPGIVYVDPATRIRTEVEGPTLADTLKNVLTIAVDPNDPTTLYANGALVSFLNGDVWAIDITGPNNRHPVINHWRPTGMPGFAFPHQFEVAAPGVLMMTLQGGSNNALYEIDLNAQSVARLPLTVPNFADDIAVIGTKVYVSTDSSGGSSILEWDRLTSTGRTVGSGYPNLKSLEPFGTQLLAGTTTGDILQIDPATGGSQTFLQTGISGSIFAIESGSSDTYFAIDTSATFEVYTTTDTMNPVFTTTETMTDMDVGVHDVASLLVFGAGCQGSNGRTPHFEHVNSPGLGVPFNARVVDGLAGANAALLFGAVRTATDLTPFGMLNCTLYTSILTSSPVVLDGNGQGDLITTVPNIQSLKGVHLVLDWAIRDQNANPLGFTSSDGAEGILR